MASAAPPWIILKARAWWPPSSQKRLLENFIYKGSCKIQTFSSQGNTNVDSWTWIYWFIEHKRLRVLNRKYAMLLQKAANVNLVNSFLLTLPNSLYTQDLPSAPGHTAGTLWSQSKRCCLPGLPKIKTAMPCIEHFYFSDKEIEKGQNKRKITDLCNKGSTKIMEQSHVSSPSSTCVRIKSGTDAAVSRQVDVALRTSLSFSTFIISAWPMSPLALSLLQNMAASFCFAQGEQIKLQQYTKK